MNLDDNSRNNSSYEMKNNSGLGNSLHNSKFDPRANLFKNKEANMVTNPISTKVSGEKGKQTKDSTPIGEDPYGGAFKKTYWLSLGLVVAFSIGFFISALFVLLNSFGALQGGEKFSFANIATSFYLCIASVACLTGSIIFFAFVTKKRNANYSSKRDLSADRYAIKSVETTAETAKKGSSTKEVELEVKDAVQKMKYCKYCRKMMPVEMDSCPICGRKQ